MSGSRRGGRDEAGDAAHQVFFHIGHAGRNVDRPRAPRACRAQRAVVVAKAQRLGAHAASRSRAATPPPPRAPCAAARPARRTVQRRHRRQAVGADGDRHARRVEMREPRQPGAHPHVAARTGHEHGARVAQPLERRRRSGARRGRPACRAAVAEPAMYSTGSQCGRAPRVGPDAERLEHVANGPASGAQELDLLGRLAEVHRQRRPRGAPRRSRVNSAGDTEYGACATTDDQRRRAGSAGGSPRRPRPRATRSPRLADLRAGSDARSRAVRETRRRRGRRRAGSRA